MKKSPRLSLRALMFLILCLAVFLGWQVHLARKQREAVAAIKAYGGHVGYDWEFVNGRRVTGRSPMAPSWLRQAIGDDFFQTVYAVDLTSSRTPEGKRRANPRKSDDVISYLASLPSLKWLIIHKGQASDHAMSTIGHLSNLEELAMFDPSITDAGVARLTELRKLKQFGVNYFDPNRQGKLTDKSLQAIARLPNLNTLIVQDSHFSDEGLSYLRNMRQLRVLLVSNSKGGTKITDAGLVYLKDLDKLEVLGIAGSKVTDKGLESLEHLDSLNELWVKPGVSKKAVDRLKSKLPKLKSVR